MEALRHGNAPPTPPRRYPALIALTVLACLASAPGHSQSPCLPRDVLVSQLQTDFGERLLWRGQLNAEPGPESSVAEIFVNPDGGTWTLVNSLPNGTSCFVAGGQRWSAPKAPGQPS